MPENPPPAPDPSIKISPQSWPPEPPPEKETYSFMRPPSEPGELGRLGDYRVTKLLGSGGMGMVFQAEDLTLKRTVALKVMRPELQRDPDAWQRVLREARTMASVKHEHLITVYQAGKEGEVIFLSMELLKGEALDERLFHEPPLKPSEIARIGREIALGLSALHVQGLIHRDIKPSNIWLEAPGEKVRVLDFGLARNADDSDITQTGHVLGTPSYMSPEQARAEPLDGRADLFSLGCVLYLLGTGQTPFRGRTLIAQLTALALDTPPPVHEVQPAIGAKLSAVIMRLLEKDREFRPDTAQALATELEALERELKNQPEPALNPPVPSVSNDAPTMKREPSQAKNAAPVEVPTAKPVVSTAEHAPPFTPAPAQASEVVSPNHDLKVIGVAVLVITLFSVYMFLKTPQPRITDTGVTAKKTVPVTNTPPPEVPPASGQASPKVAVTPDDLKAVLPPDAVYVLDFDTQDLDGVFFPPASKKVGRFRGKTPPGAFTEFQTLEYSSPHGIGMHPSPEAPAYLRLKLDGRFTEFRAIVTHNDGPREAENPMFFSVYGDDKLLWESQGFQRSEQMQKCVVSVKDVKVLELRMDTDGQSPRGAHALWYEPYLVKAAEGVKF